MSKTVSAIAKYIDTVNKANLLTDTDSEDLNGAIAAITHDDTFKPLLLTFINAPAFSARLSTEFAKAHVINGLAACRNLRSALNFSLSRFFALLTELVTAFDPAAGKTWAALSNRLHTSELGEQKLLDYLLAGSHRAVYQQLSSQLVTANPHAIYPTSSYRESEGHVESTADDTTIEALVQSKTFASIKIVDHALNIEQPLLRDMYISLGRCVCLVDQNVEQAYSEQIENYFQHYGIQLEKRVYRAMEVDKGIATVEKMLGDFKQLGVSRNEPVLLIGGGVLADTGGLACALYHRNTPYVMLSTSIVAGIDAGPSPRTCCDGFGYKNLFGAYHPPILSITDRFFFRTLHEGWLRHGIIEIVKMAVVKDAELFRNLEAAQSQLISTKFGTVDCKDTDDINLLSKKILGGALRSYVTAEYNNLYETHQCRPHAYGHTWSPGFEIEAGLLHGHAVAIGMGFGAYLSYKLDWIEEDECHRILRLISGFGLSLWHDILNKKETLWQSQQKIFQKRGQNLVAPLPKGKIGECAYLNQLSQAALYTAIDEYKAICLTYPRQGKGIDPHCRDVGLEDPSTVGHGIEESIEAAIARTAKQKQNNKDSPNTYSLPHLALDTTIS
ncbi:MAG: sedoheptulose 7-phosphate cyclase [Cyanobacteria bacterium J06573_11]